MLKSALVVACIMASSSALAAEAKITLYYGQPKSAEEFDKYYYEKHLPRVYAVKAVKKVEISRPVPTPDGKPPATYLIIEMYFDSLEALRAEQATDEWKGIAADVSNFASGGATPTVSVIEPKR
jgi:uncharacterized protein (TIGR02118 family)